MYKQIITNLVVAIVVGVSSFLGGMQYQKSQNSLTQFARRQGVVTGQNGQFGTGSTRNQNGNLQNLRPIRGEVTEIDGSTVIIKTVDGSSKIVIISDKTEITKTTAGTASDIKSGEIITVFGKEETGAVTAQTVAIGSGGFMQRNGLPQVPNSSDMPKPSQAQVN